MPRARARDGVRAVFLAALSVLSFYCDLLFAYRTAGGSGAAGQGTSFLGVVASP